MKPSAPRFVAPDVSVAIVTQQKRQLARSNRNDGVMSATSRSSARPIMVDVARQAGVSHQTVSRVLKGTRT